MNAQTFYIAATESKIVAASTEFAEIAGLHNVNVYVSRAKTKRGAVADIAASYKLRIPENFYEKK